MASKSQELERFQTADEAIDALRGNLVVKVEDPAEIQRQIMEQILGASSIDDVLGQRGTTPAQEVVDRPFTLKSVHYMKSKFDKGLPVFAVMDVDFLDDGSSTNITTSMVNVCAQAAMLWKLDALPLDVVIRRSEQETASGFHVYRLEAI